MLFSSKLLKTKTQKLAQKLGMVQEGIRKEAIFKNGMYYDIIEFGIVNKNEIL